MGSELKQESTGSENANRMYTEAEDQQILAKWWNKKLRTELAQELGRSEAALAQRFYAVLKKKGIEPKAYRANMRQQSSRRHLQPTSPAHVWTRDEDIILWRSVRAGEDYTAIANRLPGRTIQECQERYEALRLANATGDAMGVSESKAIPAKIPVQKTGFDPTAIVEQEAGAVTVRPSGEVDELDSTGGKEEDSDDFLDVLRRFPRQAGALSHRMDAIENDMKYVKGSLEFTLEHLAQGLNNVAQYLVGQEQDFTAFERVRQENQALRSELAELKQRMENDNKELRKVYNELEFWLGEFLEMRKIEKVANLGELIPKLKYSYDKFGVLLQIERET
ncbi:MAG: hypothetical protein GX998_11165 [Firmicutes bacterium]|nr:hypothetical protein [Bacillota bacterium]